MAISEMTADQFRVEEDALGDVQVPADHLWGAQTQRSHVNFPIGVERFRWGRPVIRALGILKKCAALANAELGQLPKGKVDLIVRPQRTNRSSRLEPVQPALALPMGCVRHCKAQGPLNRRPVAASGSLTKTACCIRGEKTSARNRVSTPSRRTVCLDGLGPPIVREMARKVQRPIIFPLSNPTDKSEAKADDLIRWTEGRGLVATGSPFAPVRYAGRTIPIAQCNIVFIFPAMGLGVVAAGASRVTDAMMLAAAGALAENSPALKDSSASLFPPLTDIRRVAAQIALAAGMEAQKDGVAPKLAEDELRQRVNAAQWTPAYPASVEQM